MKMTLSVLLVLAVITSCKKSGGSYVNNPDVPDYLHNRPVGASANELLSAATYTSIRIEVQYMTGYQPDGGAWANLQNMLGRVVNKPGGVSIVTKLIPASSKSILSVDDAIQIERNNRTAFTSGSELAVYVLYTNGNYIDTNVLGVAYKNTSIVLFGKKIQNNTGKIGQASRDKVTSAVVDHEFGHLLGLVDLGSPMQDDHKDASHGNHCNNSGCLMYYSTETGDILGFLLTGNIPFYDANCLADLHANGGQ